MALRILAERTRTATCTPVRSALYPWRLHCVGGSSGVLLKKGSELPELLDGFSSESDLVSGTSLLENGWTGRRLSLGQMQSQCRALVCLVVLSMGLGFTPAPPYAGC